ncbi:hypothetical protein V493_01036 [Pseudogymnoascus sp. VKM F-4281 (FW-2241)]|nr:hypothetical protein V493_01036 [Pseudogymnoascus sp. VKM F-4281 (FW-2241)]
MPCILTAELYIKREVLRTIGYYYMRAGHNKSGGAQTPPVALLRTLMLSVSPKFEAIRDRPLISRSCASSASDKSRALATRTLRLQPAHYTCNPHTAPATRTLRQQTAAAPSVGIEVVRRLYSGPHVLSTSPVLTGCSQHGPDTYVLFLQQGIGVSAGINGRSLHILNSCSPHSFTSQPYFHMQRGALYLTFLVYSLFTYLSKALFLSLILQTTRPTPASTSPSITPDRRMSDMKSTYYPKPGWWEEAGLDVLKFGYFTDTCLVRRFNLFSDQTTANNAFHERQRQCSPSNSCRSNPESGDQEPMQESKKIDDTLQQENPLAPTWDKKRIFSDLASSTDATNIAEKLDFYIWSKLCNSFISWARFALGYDEPTVSKFVLDLSALRNVLAIRFQELDQPQVWILVGEASQERNPLLRWLLASCISENECQSDPHAAISFILEPIEHLFSRETDGIIYVLKRLSILATRFQQSMRETAYVKWQRAFRNEFTFFDDINCNTPETHADSIVQADSKLFARVSTSDLVQPTNSQQLNLIGIVWNSLCSDVTASVDADYDLSVHISKVAVLLISLGDYHSATAILTGLRHAGIDLEELSAFWHLVDMKDNYGAYREEVSERHGPLILFAFPHVRQLLLHRDTTHPSFTLFQYVRFATGGLDRPIAVEGGLEGKAGPDFDCPIAMAGRAALDLDGGLEGRTFLGIPDLADPRRNDTAFYLSHKLSKHYDSSPAIPKNAPSPTVRLGRMVAIKQQPKLSWAGVHPNPPSIVAYTSGATTAQDAQSLSFLTSDRDENSFYGHPVINGQDIKTRIRLHVM